MIDLIKQQPIWSGSIFVSLVISLRLFLGLWILPHHRQNGLLKRAFWSLAVFVPFMGPLFFGAFYRVPKRRRDGGLPVNATAFYGARWN